jgi:hypothetical protein
VLEGIEVIPSRDVRAWVQITAYSRSGEECTITAHWNEGINEFGSGAISCREVRESGSARI